MRVSFSCWLQSISKSTPDALGPDEWYETIINNLYTSSDARNCVAFSFAHIVSLCLAVPTACFSSEVGAATLRLPHCQGNLEQAVTGSTDWRWGVSLAPFFSVGNSFRSRPSLWWRRTLCWWNSKKYKTEKWRKCSGFTDWKVGMTAVTDVEICRLLQCQYLTASSLSFPRNLCHCGKTAKQAWERDCDRDGAAATLPFARNARSHARTLTCLAFFPTAFRGKERLRAVYVNTTSVNSLVLLWNCPAITFDRDLVQFWSWMHDAEMLHDRDGRNWTGLLKSLQVLKKRKNRKVHSKNMLVEKASEIK